MSQIFIEENGVYGIDCSKADWASDEIHESYHNAGLHVLSDADFVIEKENKLIIVEYKNASIPNADNPKAFNPMDDKKINSVIRKFYDTLHYLTLLKKDGSKHYVYIIEAPYSDAVMKLLLRERLMRELPFKLQNNLNTGIKLIDSVSVVNIAEWNTDELFGQFPIRPVAELNT